MNRAINSAAAQQRAIGGVNDSIDIQLGDIAADDGDPGRGRFHCRWELRRRPQRREHLVHGTLVLNDVVIQVQLLLHAFGRCR